MFKISLVLFSLFAIGCSDDKKSDPEPPLLGTLLVTDSKNAAENTKFELRSGSCSKNADTGKATIALFQLGDGNKAAQISVFIKDFQSVAKSYTCKQATDNPRAPDNVGGKYDSCAVEFKVPSSPTAANLNTYAMHRNTPETKPFVYAGECSVQITTATPNIVGKVTCKQMVQIGLEGAVRNPVDGSVTAAASADFSCVP